MKTYIEAAKHPKGGAVNMDADNFRALAAQIVGRKHCLRPQAVYDWAVKHNVDLVPLMPFLYEPEKSNTALLSDILNDEYKELKNEINATVRKRKI